MTNAGINPNCLTVKCWLVNLIHFWLVVSNIFYFHPYLGKIPILTNIFQMGWNHQPGLTFWRYFGPPIISRNAQRKSPCNLIARSEDPFSTPPFCGIHVSVRRCGYGQDHLVISCCIDILNNDEYCWQRFLCWVRLTVCVCVYIYILRTSCFDLEVLFLKNHAC